MIQIIENDVKKLLQAIELVIKAYDSKENTGYRILSVNDIVTLHCFCSHSFRIELGFYKPEVCFLKILIDVIVYHIFLQKLPACAKRLKFLIVNYA